MQQFVTQLTWQPSETNITEIKSYTIFRSEDGGEYAPLVVCAVLRDFLGGIRSIEHCTTTVPPADSDLYLPDDAPVSYLDTSTLPGHTYCYYVTAQPMGNTIAHSSGSDSAPSNIACTAALIWTNRGNVAAGLNIYAVTSQAGTTLLVDSDGHVFRSTDGGTTWAPWSTIPGAPLGGAGGNLIFNNGVWLYAVSGVGAGTVSIARSVDGGQTWTTSDTSTVAAGFGYIAGNGANLLVYFTNVVNPGVDPNYARSVDNGVTWTTANPISGGTVTSRPVWNGSEFVATALDSSLAPCLITSTDGLTWIIIPCADPVDALTLVAGLYLCSADTDRVKSGASAALLAAAAPVHTGLSIPDGLFGTIGGGTYFFAFDLIGGVAASLNAVNWALATLNMAATESIGLSSAVAYDSVHNTYIAGGTLGTVCTFP